MAHLYFADVSNSTKKSTETIYEIKAPLATFDTIDLDDWEEESSNKDNSNNNPSSSYENPEKGVEETSEYDIYENEKHPKDEICFKENIKNVTLEQRDFKLVGTSEDENLNTSLVKELDTPTPTDEYTQFDNASLSTLNSETENSASRSTGTQGDLMDPNSSENNASAEEIQTQLKQKGRKHKDKASNVKYEKIDSISDISDQEKHSPFSGLRAQSNVFEIESDSSDSDSGYIRTGFVSASRGIGSQHLKAGFTNSFDSLDSTDSTPYSSPKVTRPVIPPPLSKADAAQRSKRKAYEKRIQRLKVTTKPIERPRSTTPINIHGLEEYVNFSSPEKSPAKSNIEKLKIKLPLEEAGRSRSPRHTTKSGESVDAQVFCFHEDLLFTHTKSAILLEEDGVKSQSPKRILVPPTLSPKLSPVRSPRSPRSPLAQNNRSLPRYIYSPKSPKASQRKENSTIDPAVVVSDVDEQINWARFDEVPNEISNTENKQLNNRLSNNAQIENNKVKNEGKTIESDINNDIDKNKSKCFDNSAKDDELNIEEILTVKIDETSDITRCDIECHAAGGPRNEFILNKTTENSPETRNTDGINDNGINKEQKGRNCTCIMFDDDENLDSLC